MFSSSLILTLLIFLWRFCLLTWTRFSLPTLHLWASSARKCNDFILMPHRSLFTPNVPLVQVKSLPSTLHRNWETSSSFSVTNRAMRVLLGSPSTTSYLLTMDITPTCLFLSPSLHFWRRPCSKCFSKTQPCPCWPKPCHHEIVINKMPFSTASTSTTLPCSYPFRIFP